MGAPIEINLFYQAPGRIEAITEVLQNAGAENLLGLGDVEPAYIKELSSNRRIVDPRGIAIADVVLVPLEDGDRTEALIKEHKFVIAIDLNPLSRTAQKANITIVDNIVRCIPLLAAKITEMKTQLASNPQNSEKIKAIKTNFNQKKNLSATLTYISQRLKTLAKTQERLN